MAVGIGRSAQVSSRDKFDMTTRPGAGRSIGEKDPTAMSDLKGSVSEPTKDFKLDHDGVATRYTKERNVYDALLQEIIFILEDRIG